MKGLLEVVGRDGRVLQHSRVLSWPLTLGRALDNDVVVDDPHVAAHHATLEPDADGRLILTVGDSINGVLFGDTRYAAGEQLALDLGGGSWQMGGVRLRLRLPPERLAAEQALPARAGTGLAVALSCAVGVLLLALLDHWLTLDPGADAAAWLPVVVGLPAVLAGWCGLWALASKLFQHRFDFLGHLRIALPWLLAVEGVDLVLTQIAASLGWPWLWRLVSPLQLLLAVLMLREHLIQVVPLGSRVVTAVLAAASLAGAAITLTLTQRATDRYSRPPYMSSLPLPALNLTQPVSAQQLVQDLAPVAAQLATRVQRAGQDEANDGEPGNE